MELDDLMSGQIVIAAATPEERAERRDVGWALDEAYWEELGRPYGGQADRVIRDTRRTLEPRFGAALFSGDFDVIIERSGMVGLQLQDATAEDQQPILHYGHLNESQPAFLQAFVARIQNAFALRVIAASQERYAQCKTTHGSNA